MTIDTQNDLFASLGLSTQNTQSGPTNDASDLGLDTFLKLMVTQLNNQDPFKPMENGDFLGQIASPSRTTTKTMVATPSPSQYCTASCSTVCTPTMT